MKTNRQEFALRVSAAAVQGALLALAVVQVARADEEASVKELTTPTKTIEAGAGWVSRDSFKFGEYNGLQDKGVYGIGNLDLRGGGSYDSNDTSRWRLSARNLGLDSRDAKAEYGWQGRFRINLGYDELLRNRNDTYQTPYQGIGGTHLVLPGNWHTPTYPTATTMGANNSFPVPSAGTFLGLAATGYNSPLVANTAYLCKNTAAGNPVNGCAANPAFGGVFTTGFPTTAANTALLHNNLVDLTDFRPVDLSTRRQKFDVGASFDIDSRMQVAFSMRRERKNGLKQLGVVNADGGPAGTLAGENAVIFPEVIDTVTDQYNASFNFTDKKVFFTLAYYGSIFTNNIKSMTIDNPWALGPTAAANAYGVSSAAISEEPDNSLHQFRVTAGYNLTQSIKAVADASYSHNSQNDGFVLDPAMFSAATGGTAPAFNNGGFTPVSSANALVVNKAFDLKITARPVSRLSLAAAYKYDNRDNQTPVNTFVWYDAGAKNFLATGLSPLNGATIAGLPAMTATPTATSFNLYGGANVVANRPYSRTVNQFDLDSEFTVAPGHALKLGYERQQIDRYCNGTWIDCSFGDQARENTLKSEYRFVAGESVTGRIGYDQSSRSVEYNNNAWMSLVPALAGGNIASLAAQGYNSSVLNFLKTYGLTANGLPIAANATNPISAIAASAQLTAIYNLLFGTGNGSLSQNYYANHNVTNNWAGLDVFNMADRDRSHVRGALNWQASDALALHAGADWRRDSYPSNVFGLESSNAWSLNLDGAFTPNEDLALDAYYTHEDQRTQTSNDPAGNGTVNRVGATGTAVATPYTVYPATTSGGGNSGVVGLCPGDTAVGLANPTQLAILNNNAKIDPCARWTANMRDRTDTLGLSATKKRLLSRKFSLTGDVSYSRSVTTNQMNGGFYTANTLAAVQANVPASFFISAVDLPSVSTSIARFGLSGRYQLSKVSTVRMSYSFNWLHTDDYQYSTNAPANTSGTVMPTLEQAPNYIVHVIGVSYSYSFQ